MFHRLALSVGIANYNSHECLKNPVNDAKLIASVLERRGFDVLLSIDPTMDELLRKLDELKAKVNRAASCGSPFCVIYVAGHGVELNGSGFVLPADFPGGISPSTLGLRGISVLNLVDSLVNSFGPKIVVLDICRVSVNNWMPHDLSSYSDLLEQQRAEFASAASGTNVLIAFSTSAGSGASDGTSRNSAYTEELGNALLKHGISVTEMLSEVAQKVIDRSGTKQRPWYHSNMTKQIGMSDLPSYQIVTATSITRDVERRSRIHKRSEDSGIIYHNEKKVMVAKGYEVATLYKASAQIEAIAYKTGYLYVQEKGGELYILGSDGAEPRIIRTNCRDAFGIELSPSASALVIFGIDSFQVFASRGNAWSCVLEEQASRRSFYGAVFENDHSLFICDSHGGISHIELSPEATIRNIRTDMHAPIYDLALVRNPPMLAACTSRGIVRFFDIDLHAIKQETDLGRIGRSLTGNYHRLRLAGLSPKDAVDFLSNPDEFFKREGFDNNDDDLREHILGALKPHELLCCTVTGDPRVLAVGSGEGFVHFIDVRDGAVFATVDAGGGRGVELQWITSTGTDVIAALSADGVLTLFEAVPPLA